MAYDDGSVAFNMLSVESSVWWDNQEYIIKQFQPDYSNGFTTYQITAIHVAYEVARIRQRKTKTGTLTYSVNDVLSFYLKGNTLGFTWQVIGNFGKEQITDLGNSSGKDMLDKIISTWPDAVFYADNKNIRIYQHDSIAKNLGNRIDYLHDTPELKLSYDSTNIVNQVMASGKQKENTNSDKTEYYFKPFLVTDDSSVSQWGLHPGEDVPDERFVDADKLRTFVLNNKLTPQPTLSIEVTGITNEEPNLCEIRRLENRKDEFVTEVEVVAYTYYPLDSSQATSITLNNRAKTILNYKSARDKSLQKAIQSMLNQQRGTINDLANGLNNVNDNIASTNNHIYPWQGKSITVIGDSITYGYIDKQNGQDITAPWTLQLKPLCKFGEVTNNGVGSSRIATSADEPRLSFCERVNNYTSQDFIIMFGGVNDFASDIPMGNFLDETTETFFGALEYMAKQLIQKNQNARILWCTPVINTNLNHHTYDDKGELVVNNVGCTELDYANAIKKVAGYYGFPVLDLFSNCIVNPLSRPEMFRDGTHPNKQGYVLLGQQISRYINTLQEGEKVKWKDFLQHTKDLDLWSEPSPFQNRNNRLQKDHNWSVLGWIFKKMGQAFEDLYSSIKDRFEDYDGRFNDQMNKTTSIDEVIDARRPKGKDAYKNLGEREEAQDKAIDDISQAQRSLATNTMQVNTASNVNKMSLLAVQPRQDGSADFMQTAQIDDQSGLIYIAEQTDDAGTQKINEYDLKTHELKRSRDLGLTKVVWLEGNSLFHDENGAVCFIVPRDRNGNWGIYNFDSDTWGKPFYMSGNYKYCIDNTGQYFVNMQGRFDGYNDEITLGFNVYDLASVIAGSPKLVKYIPVTDSYVHGNNKIQGFAMIDNKIYLGRGRRSTAEWFRTTQINDAGAVIGDWHWNDQQIIDLIQPHVAKDHKLTDIESEGISTNYINGVTIPVLLMLANGKDSNNKRTVDYVLINAGDPDGADIDCTAGMAVAQLSRPDYSGIVAGIPIQVNATGKNILAVLEDLKQLGTYSFACITGNAGLYKYMVSGAGLAVVRRTTGGTASDIHVIYTDYNGVTWSCSYAKGSYTGEYSNRAGWTTWSSDSNKMIVADDDAFDPFHAVAGVYWTRSAKNSPTTALNKVYEVKHLDNWTSKKYKIITCYDLKYNVVYTATTYEGTNSSWRMIAIHEAQEGTDVRY